MLSALLQAVAFPVVAQDPSGAYLAARQARTTGDFSAAAKYYAQALTRDSSNPSLLENANVAYLALGQLDRAIAVARKIEADDLRSQVAQITLIAEETRNEDWEAYDPEAAEAGDAARGDEVVAEEGDPVPVGNDHGGLQGGITTGQPIWGEATWHAPTSIPKEQRTADWETDEIVADAQVIGRHDPVLPPRGVPVVEAMLYLTVLDFMLLGGRINPDRLDGKVGAYDTDYHPESPVNDPEDAETRAEPRD